MSTEHRTLDDFIPEKGFSDDEETLDAFLSWVEGRGLSLYPAQEEAVLELFSGSHLILKTPTGSGKSLVATALHFREFAWGRRSVYTAPIKALVSEKFFALCRIFGAAYVGMMTGDGTVNRDAPIMCCTAEVLSKLALLQGEETAFDAVVMDEFHYYGDRDRGMAWQIPLLTMPQTRFLLMSATLGDTGTIQADLEERTGISVATVSSAQRPVPLEFTYSEAPLQETLDRLVRHGKAPIYVVHFTQRAAADAAGALMSVDFCTKEEKKALNRELKGFRFDSPYGPDLRRLLSHGIGLHHAGLLPKYRLLVEKLAQQGRLKIICGTDTLGVGINVPIHTVVFTQLCKFDGESVNILTVRDFKQIAGRAGRKGYDDEGLVIVQAPEWVIENKRLEAAVKSGRRNKKKFVRKKAPSRGYKHWNKQTFEHLISRPPEALESRFQVDHGILLMVLKRAEEQGTDGMQLLRELIDASHTGKRQTELLLAKADQCLEDLICAGVVEELLDEERAHHVVAEGLQRDFSLHHSLSLFLLHAISKLDAEHPEYALDLLTLVESILEHPRAVLKAQVNTLKGELVAQLKAEGMEYEERMELLSQVTWPRPKSDWIYAVYDEYGQTHPWVQAEHIRVKSVARDMVERFASFTDYVRELNLQRAEGVLLRYLTQAYKTLIQSVPKESRTPPVQDMIAFLRAMLARVDSSLLTEWEKLASGASEEEEGMPLKPVDISADKKSFLARVRAELHALVRALAREDFAEATACVRAATEETRSTWSASDFSRAIAPYLEEYGKITFDGRARLAWNTVLTHEGPHRWRVSQVLVDDEDENAWSIDGVIDISADTNPEGPLVEIVAISD